MNWNDYSKMVERKCQDAKHNLEYAEKKRKEAQIVYQSVLREKESFEKALLDLMGEGEKIEI